MGWFDVTDFFLAALDLNWLDLTISACRGGC